MNSGDTAARQQKTPIAVLGTLAEFHREPLPYDLPALLDLVAGINPDLLCLDITPEQWRRQDFGNLPPQYGEVLLPLAAQTDIVVVPIGGATTAPRAAAGGWRGALIKGLRKLLAQVQSGSADPDDINAGWRHDLGNIIYTLTRRLAGEQVEHDYHAHIEQLTRATLAAAANNPGSRILVVTNIQYCHHVRPQLGQHPEIRVTTYRDL